MNYENMGAFGRLRQALRTLKYSFPVVADKVFGHTSPMLTLPVGFRAVIDAGCERFEIVEPTVV